MPRTWCVWRVNFNFLRVLKDIKVHSSRSGFSLVHESFVSFSLISMYEWLLIFTFQVKWLIISIPKFKWYLFPCLCRLHVIIFVSIMSVHSRVCSAASHLAAVILCQADVSLTSNFALSPSSQILLASYLCYSTIAEYLRIRSISLQL